MENIREIISQNITKLRKEKNLTQVELAKKINYSDKAISRWEKGEVIPDIETIYSLSEIFEVPVSAILEKEKPIESKNEKKTPLKQRILSQIFLSCEIWLILCVVYTYINITTNTSIWQIFVWGIPATALLLLLFNLKYKNNIGSFVCGTVLTWSLIVCIYLHLIQANPWYMFFIGIPIQGLFIIRYIFNYKQKIIKKKE
jgi:transcriptional regulator with XRE-family HTH domain